MDNARELEAVLNRRRELQIAAAEIALILLKANAELTFSKSWQGETFFVASIKRESDGAEIPDLEV